MMKLCDSGGEGGTSQRIRYFYEQYEISSGNRSEKVRTARRAFSAGSWRDLRVRSEICYGLRFHRGFPECQGGTNFSAVEVKATDRPIGHSYPLDKKWYKRLAHSNVPTLLLVVDAKQNRLYHAWPGEGDVKKLNSDARTVLVPVVPIDDVVKEQIRERLVGADCLGFNSRARRSRIEAARMADNRNKPHNIGNARM
jgi:hypothetical protein